jgi:hypothetical protein
MHLSCLPISYGWQWLPISVTAGFYRTCVIDGILEHSPAEHVRRPAGGRRITHLGFTHLQFELGATERSDLRLGDPTGLLLRPFPGHCRPDREASRPAQDCARDPAGAPAGSLFVAAGSK